MTNIDQYESVFKSAAKTLFEFERLRVARVLVVTDLEHAPSQAFADRMKEFLAVLDDPVPEYHVCSVDEYRDVGDLLLRIQHERPDLICTYRNLRAPAHDHPYSLGSYVDVLTQATAAAVLLVPYPTTVPQAPRPATSSVMVVTDHLAGDHRLVNAARHFTRRGGMLILSHVEDQRVFDRYMNVISKIPSIDTDDAREAIRYQLLKEPADYIESCRKALAIKEPELTIESHVAMGHLLRSYRQLINEHNVDLLVMNTKDEDQLAMHGVAYPLSVEFRDTPLLLL